LARSEWLGEAYGSQIIEAMTRLKQAADPQGILNPGKILNAKPMDTQFRFGLGYESRAWETGLDFSSAGGLEMAIEQCNGQGVCRKDTGAMCPSFQATREEMDSTRGRANLLRSLISTQTQTFRSQGQEETISTELVEATHDALDLCLACKGCKAECPSGVDMAKIKFAFEDEYYKTHHRPASDYLFGYFHVTAGLLAPIAPLANLITGNSFLRKGLTSATGISWQRAFPQFSAKKAKPKGLSGEESPAILFLSDAYTHFIEPQVEQAAFDVLEAMGRRVIVLPIVGAGASMLSKGFISAASKHAGRVLDHLRKIDPECNLHLVGLEPPEIYCLKNDYTGLLRERKDEIVARGRKSWLLDEYLVRFTEGRFGPLVAGDDLRLPRIIFHPHCHQRAEAPSEDGMASGKEASMELLRRCGYAVELIEAGCCGMAGTFGYEARHYELSQQIGELKLFPAIRKAFSDPTEDGRPIAQIASTGSACRLQISQGTAVAVAHPIELVARSLLGEQR
jgi:Fe-S oxidoreductase